MQKNESWSARSRLMGECCPDCGLTVEGGTPTVVATCQNLGFGIDAGPRVALPCVAGRRLFVFPYGLASWTELASREKTGTKLALSLIHISEPTRPY